MSLKVATAETKKTCGIDIRDAFFDRLYELAEKDRGLVFITADMSAFGLGKFKKDLAGQYINIGVAEQNMIAVAAGLALEGKRVFVYGIAPFVTMRCYEQIKVNLSGMNLPVTIIGMGPGITYGSDGYTHHAVQDISIMRALPNIVIFNPSDHITAAKLADISYKSKNPVYIRLDKGALPQAHSKSGDFSEGLSLLKDGKGILIISTGIMVHQALQVSRVLSGHSVEAAVLDLYRIKPLNEELLLSIIGRFQKIVILEEHAVIGGAGSAICELLLDKDMRVGVKRMGISDNYCPGYGDREWMRSFYGLDTGSIVSQILNWHPHAGCKAKKEPPAPKDSCFKLALDDFSRIFAASGKDMPGECVKFAAHADFGYSVPAQEAQEKIILDILKTIDSNSLSVAGPHRKDAWEKGWSQNLRNFTQSNFDLSELVPKFVKPKGMIRLEGRYILPDSQDFETAFVTMLRFYLFRKYFSEVDSVYEFGCGTGLNLVALARMFPDKRLFGLDWSRVSCEIIDKIAQTKKMNLNGVLFDMFEPDYKLKLAPGSAVFTIGAMEQLGKNFAPFLSFLLKKKPSICINIETLYELYSPDSLFDYAAAKYIEKRGYLQGYLSRLRQLEQEKKVQIIKVQRTFGNLYHDGYSFVIWRPRG